MRQSAGIGLALAVGAAAVAAPILLAVRLAWRLSAASEQSRVTSYASETLRRGNEAGRQMDAAFAALSSSRFPACSPQDVAEMRRIHLNSGLLQAVSRISGNTITCTSMGTTAPIPLGRPAIDTGNGIRDWLNLRLPLAPEHPVAVVAKGDIALMVDPEMPLDTFTDGRQVALALYFPSIQGKPLVISRHGAIQPDWYRDIPRATTTTFLADGHIVSIARGARGDIAAVAAAPESYILLQVRRFAVLLIPIGIACGFALAWAVLYIARVQMALPSLLRAAARRREFFVEYQPIVDLQTGQWVGAEALVRWRRGRRTVMPDIFIASAEQSGMIRHITRCVADIVARDLPAVLRVDPDFYISMNLSAADLRSEQTLTLLERTLRDSGARPVNLRVEATEHGFLNASEIPGITHNIRRMGIALAVDDFGTGYSSFSTLQTLGPDVLKIDKSFITALRVDGPTRQVVPHIIEMAHTLGLTLVAEGVETEDQAEFLRAHGVIYAQGWHFGQPMPLRDFLTAFRRQSAKTRTVAALPA